MECSICHKEFGNGGYCQNCGTDRITGLANYHGFPPADNNGAGIDYYNSGERTMVCHVCGKVIPADSKFCPVCSKSLFVKCPKCGHEYSSQYPSCNQCGTNREQYQKEEKERQERQRREEIKKQEEWEKQRQKAEELARKKAEEERIKEEKRLEAERKWRESYAGKKAIRDNELRDWAVKYCDDELKNNKSEFHGCLVGIIIFTVFSPLIVVLGGILVAGLLTPFTNFEPSEKVHQISMVVMAIVCFILFISLLFSLKLPHNQTKKNILKELSQDKLDEEKKKYLKALYDQVYGKEG